MQASAPAIKEYRDKSFIGYSGIFATVQSYSSCKPPTTFDNISHRGNSTKHHCRKNLAGHLLLSLTTTQGAA
jgi:hypothetical protein